MDKMKNRNYMNGRSCKHCKWIGKKSLFVGKVNWCGANERETTSDAYCINFIPKKK